MSSRRTDTLHAVLPPARAWPLFDAAATREVERRALQAAAPHALMARAGHAVARLALATQPQARSVLALAGPGNNGGDAVVAAAALLARGWHARAVLLGDPARLPADAAWALADAREQGLPVLGALPDALEADLLLDGLLGVGATRAPEGLLAQAIGRLNRAGNDGRAVMAIDLPSGLDPDRGTCLGAEAVRARHTLSLLTLKPGLFTGAGRDHAGRVWLDTLAVEAPASACRLVGPPSVRAVASHASHKGRFGDVGVVGGASGMTGAARLAARAALGAGAGRVYLGLLDVPGPGPDTEWPELMQRPLATMTEPAWLDRRTVVAGCGGGERIGAVLPALIAHSARLVLDADALNTVATEPGLQRTLTARHRRGRPTVLTPHPLEAARLLGTDVTQVQADRTAAARALAGRCACVVVLKGSGTVLADPDGRVAINPTGNALLSAAGTGDVLAGWLGGAWARAGERADALEIAAEAVYRHGEAADRAARQPSPPPALHAGELVELMRRAPG